MQCRKAKPQARNQKIKEASKAALSARMKFVSKEGK